MNPKQRERIGAIAGQILSAKAIGLLAIYNENTGSETIDPEDIRSLAECVTRMLRDE
jgi:hypothetical protein